MEIHVCNFSELKMESPNDNDVVLTVSKSTNWSQGLSPFFVGPCELYKGYVSKNMENAWQFSKVYKEHLDGEEISPFYWSWAKKGWDDDWAHRYPMGKGRIPEFSLWNDERLDYIEARKKIYIPLYRDAVKKTYAFKILRQKYESYKKINKELYLVDFDAYMHKKLDMSYDDVVNNPKRKMGHAFVLAMMLEDPDYVNQYE